MPRYEDLKFIKDKVLGFGNEAAIRKEKGESVTVDDLPPEVVSESNPALDDIDSLLDDITDDLNEGLGYSEAAAAGTESDLGSMTLDDTDEDKLSDSLADVSLDDIMPDAGSLGDIDDKQWDDISDGSFEDLQNLSLDEEMSDAPQDSGSQNGDALDIDNFDIGDINFDDISSDDEPVLPDETDTDNSGDSDNNEETSFGSDTDLPDNDGSQETDALLSGLNDNDDDLAAFSLDDTDTDNFINNDSNNNEEMSFGSDTDLPDNDESQVTDALLSGSDDNDDDLAAFSLDDTDTDNFINNDSNNNEEMSFGSDTDLPDNDESQETDALLSGSGDNDDDLAAFSLDDTDISADDGSSSDEPSSFDMPDLSDYDGNMDLNIGDEDSSDDNDPFSLDDHGSFGSGNESFDGGDTDPMFSDLNFGETGSDGLSFDNGSDEGGLSFDNAEETGMPFDDLSNNTGTVSSDEPMPADETDQDADHTDNEEIPPQDADDALGTQSGNEADESGDDIAVGQDGSIKLTDAQRKQIVMSLSVMPKEAEIKIAQEIVDEKYSDEQLKPLINALASKEKVVNVLRIYEKISGDTSLAHIRTRKQSGQEFSEQKKSLSYQFRKNIMPIISRLALIMIVLLSLILLYVRLIDPTLRASHYYKTGKKNLAENKFDNVEPYFDEAYKLQRRYGQVLDYARLYRAAKRYKAAEVKYDTAYSLKQNKPLALEIADFYREMKDYGTAVRRYEDLNILYDADQEVLVGLGRTHLDWAMTDYAHLETAKSIFQDVIDMNDKNKDAVFYMMDIAIREGNDRNVMKYYGYIDNVFETKKVEDKYIDAYLDLADFMLSTKRYNEMKDILDKTAKNPKTHTMPRQEYMLAKLKKALNVSDEERIHLNNVIKLFDYIKTAYPLEYNTKQSMSLLSETYNALGENADQFSRGSIEAEQNFIKAAQYDPLNGRAFYNLGNYELNYKATRDALENAKNNLLNAEKLGYTNDRLNFNLGWIAYKQHDYRESFRRIGQLSGRYNDNANLKLFLGTVYYKLGNYDYAEAYLKENFDHFINLKQIHYPLDMELNDDRQIAEMLVNCANNLGAVYHKKYQQSGKSGSRDMAAKCYEDSMEYYDKLKESKEMFLYEVRNAKTADAREVRLRQLQVTYAHQNLRNILYPSGSSYEPVIFEEFPLQYESSM